MKTSITASLSILATLAVLAGTAAAGKSATVTMQVPVRIYDLHADVQSARVRCLIPDNGTTDTYVGDAEIPLKGRGYVGTLRVVVRYPAERVSSLKTYSCGIQLYNGSAYHVPSYDAAEAWYRANRAGELVGQTLDKLR